VTSEQRTYIIKGLGMNHKIRFVGLGIFFFCTVFPGISKNAKKITSDIPVSITSYSAPYERDYGTGPLVEVSYSIENGTEMHRSKFVKDFVSRYSSNPRNPGLSGVAMEGSGYIDFSLHKNDPYLMKLYEEGYRTLEMKYWDPIKKEAHFYISKAPKNVQRGNLKLGVSAAVKKGNKLFPLNRWVAIKKDGKILEYRFVDDECSSCETEKEIDLFVPAKTRDTSNGDYHAQLMPVGFQPEGPHRMVNKERNHNIRNSNSTHTVIE
jgi:hypothetical protein